MSLLKRFLMQLGSTQRTMSDEDVAYESISDWFNKNLKKFKDLSESFKQRKTWKFLDNTNAFVKKASKDPEKYDVKVVEKKKDKVYILTPSGAAKILKDPSLLGGSILTGSALAAYAWTFKEESKPLTTLRNTEMMKQLEGVETLLNHMKTILGNFDQFTTDYVYRHKLVNILVDDETTDSILYTKGKTAKERMQFQKWSPGSKDQARPKDFIPKRYASAKDAGYTEKDIRVLYEKVVAILNKAGSLSDLFEKNIVKAEVPDQKQEFAAIAHATSAMELLDTYLSYYQKTFVPNLLRQLTIDENYKLPK